MKHSQISYSDILRVNGFCPIPQQGSEPRGGDACVDERGGGGRRGTERMASRGGDAHRGGAARWGGDARWCFGVILRAVRADVGGRAGGR
jgi:hypothetical protein